MPLARSRNSAQAAVELGADTGKLLSELCHVAPLDGAQGQPELHRRGDEALLGAVVKVSLDSAPGRVSSFDDACARGLELRRQLAQLIDRVRRGRVYCGCRPVSEVAL